MSTSAALWFETAKLLLAVVALSSAYFAFKTYKANLTKQQEDRVREADKELVSQAKLSLQWAYEALTDGGTSVPPVADRVNWLTCARHILRHAKVAERIQGETYRLVHAEHQEYWRHRFYLALDHRQLLNARYYMTPNDDQSSENIEVTSALVVVDFSTWPEKIKDPTDEVNRSALIAGRKPFRGFAGRGLRAYIEALEEARQL